MHCVVPHCQHTRGQHKGERPFTDTSEWICGEHWRLTSRVWRRRRALFRRRGRSDLAAHMWARLKAQAIERAAGL